MGHRSEPRDQWWALHGLVIEPGRNYSAVSGGFPLEFTEGAIPFALWGSLAASTGPHLRKVAGIKFVVSRGALKSDAERASSRRRGRGKEQRQSSRRGHRVQREWPWLHTKVARPGTARKRHARKRHGCRKQRHWIPAFAGMTLRSASAVRSSANLLEIYRQFHPSCA